MKKKDTRISVRATRTLPKSATGNKPASPRHTSTKKYAFDTEEEVGIHKKLTVRKISLASAGERPASRKKSISIQHKPVTRPLATYKDTLKSSFRKKTKTTWPQEVEETYIILRLLTAYKEEATVNTFKQRNFNEDKEAESRKRRRLERQ